MTAPRGPGSLRTGFLLALSFTALYLVLIAAYITWQTGRTARLGAELRMVAEVLDAVNHRAASAHSLGLRVEATILRVGGPSPEAMDTLRRLVRGDGTRAAPRPFASVPAAMRTQLARADAGLARMETALPEAVALAELGRLEDARRLLTSVDSLEHAVDLLLSDAQQRALSDLVARQAAFRRESGRAVRVVAFWAGLGVLGALLLWWAGHRRVLRPLERLDDALARVAAGDLTVRVEPAADDEMGRLSAHFNETTRVLRDRAEHQGRLAAAGELVAGVAHEVNNPLMAIALTAEGRLEEGGVPADVRGELQQIVRQARRAGTLLRGLLRFARPGERVATDLDLNLLVSEGLDLLSYQFGVDEVSVERRLAPDLPSVHGDPSRIEQVIVNLVGNAVQALRDREPPRRLAVQTWADGDRVCLAVEDQGPGVPPAVRDRIFLPFFTTKGEQGTGLGLYISRQVARELGGDLTLDPDVADGARFVLRLPASPGAAAGRASGAPVASTDRPLDGLRVLVVDDEESVRRPLATFLQRRGAQVLQAPDGLDALTKVERYPVDVILLDLRMPRMDGVECFEEIAKSRPALAERVIIVSGDLRQLDGTSDLAVPPERILAKPVDLPELERRVRAVATASPPPSSS